MISPYRSLQEYLNGFAFKLAPREVEVIFALHRSPEGLTAHKLAELVYSCTYEEDQMCIRKHISNANMKCARTDIPQIVVSMERGKWYRLTDYLLALQSDPQIQIVYFPRGRAKQLRNDNI